MAANISEELRRCIMVESDDGVIPLHVMLEGDVGALEMADIARVLSQLPGVTDVQELPFMRMITCRSAAGSVGRLAAHKRVQWIDRDSRASTKELIDE